jgi:hypothetical protein
MLSFSRAQGHCPFFGLRRFDVAFFFGLLRKNNQTKAASKRRSPKKGKAGLRHPPLPAAYSLDGRVKSLGLMDNHGILLG